MVDKMISFSFAFLGKYYPQMEAKSWNISRAVSKANQNWRLFTLLWCQSEWPNNKPFLLMHSRHARVLYDSMIFFFDIRWTLFEIILFLFIHFYPLKQALGRIQKQFMIFFKNGLLFTTSNEYIWPKIFLIFMPWVKSAVVTIFQKGSCGTF